VGWLLLALHLVFWSPMILRIARRKTPETTIVDELKSSYRIPGLLMYWLGNPLIWIGLATHAWTSSVDPAFTIPALIGLVLQVVAIGLMFWAFAVHRSWNIEPRLEPDHQLCIIGPYGLVRHPIYVAFDLLGLGAAILAPGPAVILGALLLIIGGDLRARAEETVLTEAFGDHYRTYMRRVNRAIPGVY